MFRNRIRLFKHIILMLALIVPAVAFADWHIYYTGKARSMFGAGARGNFATKSQCEGYKNSRPGFERANSYCSGADRFNFTPSQGGARNDGGASEEQQRQQMLQKEQMEKEQQLAREQELARQRKFAEEKAELLETLRGGGKDSTSGQRGGEFKDDGALNLKSPNSGTLVSCIEKGKICTLNGDVIGSPCCAPYKCKGKFPNTYCK
jgi:hypothetical protein